MHTEAKAARQKEEEVVHAVERWLGGLEMGIGAVCVRDESIANVREERDGERLCTPCTPVRRTNVFSQTLDEISPTDSYFTYGGVFDEQERGGRGGGYAETEASSLEDDERQKEAEGTLWRDACHTDLHHQEKSARPVHSATEQDEGQRYEATNLDANTEFSLCTDDASAAPSTALARRPTSLKPVDPSAPRIIWITSCLQCVLANLPCSRTPPTCSRCARRKSSAEQPCLLHRRRLPQEMVTADHLICTSPVLLRLHGEDEETWECKSNVCEEVCLPASLPLHSAWLIKSLTPL